MATYVFSGRVLPERVDFSIGPIELNIGSPDAPLAGQARISIESSQVSVMLRLDSEGLDIPTLKNAAESLVRMVADTHGYLTGRGYDVEITSSVDASGMQTVFGVGVHELEATQAERPLTFLELVEVAGPSVHLRRALADLREAIRSPDDTAFYCYRAIESAMHSFSVNAKMSEDQKAVAWQRMRDALQIDRSWFQPIQRAAESQRHGHASTTTGQQRIDLMIRAWKTVDRYCLYLRGGEAPLLAAEFPILGEPP